MASPSRQERDRGGFADVVSSALLPPCSLPWAASPPGPENPFEFDRRNVLILTFFYPMDLRSGKQLIAGPCSAIIMRQRRK